MSETTDRTGLRAGIGRIPIMAVQPVVDGGRFPARCVEGETVTVSANAFREGHDLMGVQLPRAPWPQGTARVLLDTSVESPEPLPEEPLVERSLTVTAGSVVVLGITPD